MLLYDVLQRVLHDQPTAHLGNLDLAASSLDVLEWAGKLDGTGKQYHTLLKPIYILACNSVRQATESSPNPTNDHVHFIELHGASPIHEAAHEILQMLYVALRPEPGVKTKVARYRPSKEETATSVDEVGLGVHLYWAMEFDAESTRLENPENLRNTSSSCSSSSLLPSIRGHFAGGKQPCGWTTTKSFDDPSLTGGSTTDLFG